MQLQVYMWLRRVLFNDPVDGIFCYISKDDCMIAQASIKFNQRIIDECIIPVLDIINEAYEKRDPNLAPAPELAVYAEAKNQYQKNWLCTYCDYHSKCAGAGWMLEATNMVTLRNKELQSSMGNFATHAIKKEKPKIEVVETIK